MQRFISILVVWSLFAPWVMAADAPKIEAQRVLAAWANTWPTNDADKMMAFYESASTLTSVESRGVMHKGAIELRRMYLNVFAELAWEKVALEELNVTQDNHVALASFRFKGAARMKNPAMPMSFDYRGTMVLRWDGQSWRIAQEHFSPIAEVPRVQKRPE